VQVYGHHLDDLLTLEPDEVAMAILPRLRQLQAAGGGIGYWNFLLEAKRAASDAGADPDRALEAGRRIGEAWQWMRTEGLIAPHPEHDGVETLTRASASVDPRRYVRELRGLDLLRHAQLDSELEAQVIPLFRRGAYDVAVLGAMRLVEDRVRFAGKFGPGDLGVSLMRAAFGKSGRLTDAALDPGEKQGQMELFAGAIGVFKNPPSHRVVAIDDAQEAAEAVLLANALLRILGRAVKATRGPGRPRKR
jgi:uncharacterized protein (TIGR02391 family)